MVLDEASPTSSELVDDAPSSDSDPFSAQRNGDDAQSQTALPSHINLNSLPRPIPIIGPLMGYTEGYLVRMLRSDAARISAIVQRPLRPEEWDASAQSIGKLYATNSFGPAIGILAGWLRADSTKAEFRFPFFKPDLEKFDFQSMPGTSLKGARAAMAWHWLRRFSYLCVSVPAAKLIVTSYALSTFVAGQYRDPRLKDMWDAMKNNTTDEMKRRARSAGMGGTGRLPVETQQGQWQYNTQPQQQQQQQQQQYDSPYSPFGTTASPSQDTTSTPFSFDDDDASPTAGNGPLAPIGAQSSTPHESAWDRVRRGSAPLPPPDRPAQTPRVTGGGGADAWARVRGGSSSTSASGSAQQDQQRQQGMFEQGDAPPPSQQQRQESYAFSARDSERQMARDEAQRDFDAKLERERHGGDFGGGDGQGQGGGGWRR